ncbi:cobalamin synthesis protein P47K [Nitrosococcus halophilus Nc 4]|uniref:Cobalamin synthesis protein P47K n=1 Tax=Nitrosococcus halophilus (strain Nc4) TaxID=472759 RepID=D5BYM6_NITHN|nr:GTP-binding protein [Nitrosococcus halophilus]ADE16014.1 cobalamin synthesis protein P47K [Nitrosococcus halophilus Nc 4]
MPFQTPLILLTGPLGSGKTTLLQHMVQSSALRLALLINEFGEFGIDGKLVKGKNLQIIELEGGCVCCSLIGEFEAALEEIIETAAPEAIVVEATGVAEPDALVFDVSDLIPQVRMDGVITIMDADAMVAFPDLGHTIQIQVKEADLLLLNKSDLVSPNQQQSLQTKLRTLNSNAPIIPTTYCQVDPELLFGLVHHQRVQPQEHSHQLEYQSFSYRPIAPLQRSCFERLVKKLGPEVYRAKGFVPFPDGNYLFNYVNGRWTLESLPEEEAGLLVFIGQDIKSKEAQIMESLRACEISQVAPRPFNHTAS